MHLEQHTELDNLITMQTCALPRTRGVTTPTTSTPPSQVMSPTTWSSASSATPRVPSPTLPSHRTWTWTTLHSASCSPKHTENMPITAIQKACQSVSQSSLSVVFDRTRKPVGERNVDQSSGFGVTRNTYSAHSKFSENTQAEKVVDRTGKPVAENSSNAQIRTLLDEQRQMIIAEYCEKSWSSRILSSSSRRRPPNSTRRIMASANGFS